MVEVIKYFKKGKSAGDDKITPELLKNMEPQVIQMLSLIKCAVEN